MLTNSRSLCLSNPYIVGGLVAGFETPGFGRRDSAAELGSAIVATVA